MPRCSARTWAARGGGGESNDGAAAAGPGVGEDFEGGGLAGAGRCDRELELAPGGGEFADEPGLPVVQGGAVGDGFEQGQLDELGVDSASGGELCGGEEVFLGGDDASGAVGGGASQLVHAVSVAAA